MIVISALMVFCSSSRLVYFNATRFSCWRGDRCCCSLSFFVSWLLL